MLLTTLDISREESSYSFPFPFSFSSLSLSSLSSSSSSSSLLTTDVISIYMFHYIELRWRFWMSLRGRAGGLGTEGKWERGEERGRGSEMGFWWLGKGGGCGMGGGRWEGEFERGSWVLRKELRGRAGDGFQYRRRRRITCFLRP